MHHLAILGLSGALLLQSSPPSEEKKPGTAAHDAATTVARPIDPTLDRRLAFVDAAMKAIAADLVVQKRAVDELLKLAAKSKIGKIKSTTDHYELTERDGKKALVFRSDIARSQATVRWNAQRADIVSELAALTSTGLAEPREKSPCGFVVGDVCRVPASVKVQVAQVISSSSALLTAECDNKTFMFLAEGMDFSTMVDDRVVSLPRLGVIVDRITTYETALGGSRTVFVVIPFEDIVRTQDGARRCAERAAQLAKSLEPTGE